MARILLIAFCSKKFTFLTMGHQTEKRNQFIRGMITALIMPVTIMAGYALGSLICILFGKIFYGNPDLLFKSDNIVGKIGIAISYLGALIGAVFPWVILFVINPESKNFKRNKKSKDTVIQV